jgi:pSer/pThr/pTyr-binding forkhead associated (FHA) protein
MTSFGHSPELTFLSQSAEMPFVGPRSYNTGEKLFGRKRETLELLDRLVAERIVLLYSPSGAGKTSLVQAALVPALRDEDFTVPTVARVKFDVTKGLTEPSANRYVFAVLLSLEEVLPREQQFSTTALARMTLSDYLEQRWPVAAERGGWVLIVDQFEEVLIVDPTDWPQKKEFFSQLGSALRSEERWALFSMREEHIAALEPYRDLIPTRLRSDYRIDLLNYEPAQEAMRKTTELAHVVFEEDAARRLADDLRRVKVQRSETQFEEQLGPTVEPTVLQVVCWRLWSRLPSGKKTIDEADVLALGSVDTAIADYYAETMKALGGRERGVRQWIGEELITQRGLRNQVLQEDAFQSGLLDAATFKLLEDRHLIRAERRRGVTWLELAHDRLVTPIINNNTKWLEATLTAFQRQAVLWEKQHQAPSFVLAGSQLHDAIEWAATHQLTDTEQAYLAASIAINQETIRREQEKVQREVEKRRQRRFIVAAVVAISSLAIAFGTIQYVRWLREQPWAYVSDLIKSSEIYPFRGPIALIGRKEISIKNYIKIPHPVVSRLQILVFNNGQSLDLRSLNGTILNGRFMRYGADYLLHDQDILAISGVSAFRVYLTGPSYIPFVTKKPQEVHPLPADAWGMLIDGSTRTISTLTEPPFFLNSGSDQSIELSKDLTDSSIVEVGQDPDRGFTMRNRSKQYSLFAMFKYEDRTYLSLQVPPGRTVFDRLKELGRHIGAQSDLVSGTEYTYKMSFCLGSPKSQKLDEFEGLAEIESEDEPACAVGPFQIVVLRVTDQ